jgi:two-component system, OmpR family, phosphate regulon response regulator PhoB
MTTAMERRMSGRQALSILIVERDTLAMRPLQGKLAQAGFKVTMVDRSEDALAAIDNDLPSLVMLDWDLPAVITTQLVNHVRRRSLDRYARLMVLSTFGGEQHVVSGFELGADDYVVKPFSVPEVVARVRAILRPMRGAADSTDCIEFHELRIDSTENHFTVGGHTVTLRGMEYRLLQFLMSHPERVFVRETLLDCVWGRDCAAGARTVNVTVQRLRKALARHGCGGYLQSVRGTGYRLSAAPSGPTSD